ncbi:alcohol dehydrogenase, partial [Thermodesulfobacteriota bacterium]
PLACALNALEQLEIAEGEDVLILGGGPVGLLMALAAKSLGASPFVVEPNEAKLSAGRAFRSALRIHAGPEPISRLSDAAVNATSAPEAFVTALLRVRAAGRVCYFSGLPKDTSTPVEILNEIHYRQLRVSGAYGCTRSHLVQALGMLEEYQDAVGLLIEGEIALEQVPEALPRIASGEAMKIVVSMGRHVD